MSAWVRSDSSTLPNCSALRCGPLPDELAERFHLLSHLRLHLVQPRCR